MALSIKDPQTDRLVRRLAECTGENLTEAVRKAVQERLDRERQGRAKRSLTARLLEIGRRCAAHMPEPFHSSDHSDLLYDESGLPR